MSAQLPERDGLPSSLLEWLGPRWRGEGKLLVLTGAGVSAESGIPTFRGEEGYWRIGSRNYFPEELATRAAFRRMPDEIWGWYLYRRSVCRAASPNPAHLALAELERGMRERDASERFVLVTQNVDGLHLRAGNTPKRTFQIHGNLDLMRDAADVDPTLYPLPRELGVRWQKGRKLQARERELLVLPDGRPARPHVLWFDETYDEPRFRFESTLQAAAEADLFLVVGTSGSTNLPAMVVELAVRRNAPLLVINREVSPFAEVASRSANGHYWQQAAGVALPSLVDWLLDGCKA